MYIYYIYTFTAGCMAIQFSSVGVRRGLASCQSAMLVTHRCCFPFRRLSFWFSLNRAHNAAYSAFCSRHSCSKPRNSLLSRFRGVALPFTWYMRSLRSALSSCCRYAAVLLSDGRTCCNLLSRLRSNLVVSTQGILNLVCKVN